MEGTEKLQLLPISELFQKQTEPKCQQNISQWFSALKKIDPSVHIQFASIPRYLVISMKSLSDGGSSSYLCFDSSMRSEVPYSLQLSF